MTVQKGRFDWYDLMTSDVAAAKAFYSKVIGWKTSKWEQGDYELWNVGERGIGGMMPLSEDAKKKGMPPHWMAYIETDDADATAKRAQALGGQLLWGPEDIPSVGRFAVLADPQGAVFAVLHPSKTLTPPLRPSRRTADKSSTDPWMSRTEERSPSAWIPRAERSPSS
jgi:predicted enzyme related to lactoylglutathione lyase